MLKKLKQNIKNELLKMELPLNKPEAVLLMSVLKQSAESLKKQYSELTILEGKGNGFTKEMAMALVYQMNELEGRIEQLLEVAEKLY